MKKVVVNGRSLMADRPFSSDSASCQTTKQAAFWAACLVVGTFPAVAFAADQTFDTASTPPEIWQPPSFDVQQWDWIQLDTGEWVKGRIKVLHEESVEIDSDHFDLISIDWEDVAYIRTGRVMSVLLDGGEVILGRLTTERGNLLVGGEPVEFPQVVGIASASPREFDLWSADISVGLNFRSGNVEQKDLNTKVSLKRRTVKNNTKMSYTGNYSESESEQLANNHTASLSHDFRISHKWFFRPIQAEYYRDPFQNREAEWTVGFGAGYQIFDTPKLDWTVSAGPGYQRTEYVDVVEGEDRTVSTPALLLGTFYDQEVTDNIDFQVDYQVSMTETKAGRAKHDFYMALDVDLTSRLDLRLAGTWKRIESPQPDSDGITPEKDDFTATLGLALEI
jgi:putative salt-induced outer membrane protein YdiY